VRNLEIIQGWDATIEVKYLRDFIKGTFLNRVNRFLVEVQVEGRVQKAFLPNSGRLQGVLIPGRTVLLKPQNSVSRKTVLDLWGVFDGRIWILVDSRMANRLLPWTISKGTIPYLRDLSDLKPEVKRGGKRFDFFAYWRGKDLWIEAKSVTLVRDGLALFPDAPTPRGRDHLKALRGLSSKGSAALVTFMVLREDASAFAPNREIDPGFAEALTEAVEGGVMVEALCFTVGEGTVLDAKRIPVIL